MAEILQKNNFPENTSPVRIRLHYLDGLRGIAALYVVFSHIWELQGENLPKLWLNASRIFQYGSFSVSVFIVLSGYCLMLPVCRSQSGYIPGSLIDYFKRRAKRILPPYYAALVLSILFSLVITVAVNLHIFSWNDELWGHFTRKFSLSDILFHLLTIHNLFPGDRAYHINGPMWSVATEWQIYFIFPLILLPVWRRWGIIAVVSVAFTLGLVPHYFLNKFIEPACPWYLGLFALGMSAVEINFSQKQYLVKLKKSLPWGLFAIIAALFAVITEWNKLVLDSWVYESLAGLATACLLIYCTKNIASSQANNHVVKFLQSPVLTALGTFSYSLYLTHVLILTPLNQYLHSLTISATTNALILYTVTIPTTLLFAYGFYLICERTFMSGVLQKRKLLK